MARVDARTDHAVSRHHPVDRRAIGARQRKERIAALYCVAIPVGWRSAANRGRRRRFERKMERHTCIKSCGIEAISHSQRADCGSRIHGEAEQRVAGLYVVGHPIFRNDATGGPDRYGRRARFLLCGHRRRGGDASRGFRGQHDSRWNGREGGRSAVFSYGRNLCGARWRQSHLKVIARRQEKGHQDGGDDAHGDEHIGSPGTGRLPLALHYWPSLASCPLFESGSRTENVLPDPTSLSIHTRPP